MSAMGEALAAATADKTVEPGKKVEPHKNSDGVVIERKTRSRIAAAQEEFLTSGEVTLNDSGNSSGDVVNTDPSGVETPPASGETKPPLQTKKQTDQDTNFKALREARDHANAKAEEYKTQLDKVKDYDEWKAKAEQLEAELNDIKPKFQELTGWQDRYGLVRTDQYIEQFTKPRGEIATIIRAELEADGIDATLWDDAQNVKTRRELESLVNEHIESELLKNQFYQLYFKDLDIRQREQAALAAPKEYLDKVRSEELERKAIQDRELETTYNTVWGSALADAEEMAQKLGPNKIVEITPINGNTQHNKETVAPILEVADKAAKAELDERRSNGLPVTRQIAANVVYKWRQAVAAQAVNQDRLRWFNQYNTVKGELDTLQAKYDELMANASPTPGSTHSGGSTQVTGDSFQSRLSSLVAQVKEGK